MKPYKELLGYVQNKEGYNMIVIEGVVGCGKTTVMDLLEKEGMVAYAEPVVDNPILDKFYYDRPRYAFPLQVFFLNKRFEHLKDAAKIENAVLDRSIYGDAIFAKLLNKNGEMSDEEYQIYEELLINMLEHVEAPKLMVYLRISVDGAIKRIQKRGRDYEQEVEREYWENLNIEYEKFFDEFNLPTKLLIVDVDERDFIDNKEDKEFLFNEIKKAIKEQ